MATTTRQQQHDSSELMTIPEFAKEARIGRSLAYALARDGRIPVLRLGKLIRIPRSALGVEK